jgi:hypothetical protein
VVVFGVESSGSEIGIFGYAMIASRLIGSTTMDVEGAQRAPDARFRRARAAASTAQALID